MRICLVTSSYPRFEEDGNARFVRSIAEAQAARGHEVHVVAPYAPEVRPYPSPVHLHWFRYVWPARLGVMGHARALENDRRLRAPSYWQAPAYLIAQSLNVFQVVRRHRVELLHAHWVVPNGVSAEMISRLLGVPLYVSLHGSDIYLAMRSAWPGRAARRVFRRSKGVTACSVELADGAVQVGAVRERIHLIPWGASPEVFNSGPDDGHLRERLGMPGNSTVILGLGRLVAKKGFANLVRCMPYLLAKQPDAWLVIAGDGPERDRLANLADQLNVSHRLILPGPVQWKDVRDYMRMSSVFVAPSVRDADGNLDGLPTTVLEAMAAGRPVVATSVGGIPLVVEHGETGLIVPEADVTALAGAIAQLLASTDQRRFMGQNARERVERDLNWASVARQFDELYECRPSTTLPR